MITNQRKNKLSVLIRNSRARLLDTHPYFALLLMYLKFVAVPKMKKISTDGRCIYFAPEYIEKLHWNELDFILCHQVLHIICGHIWRDADKTGDDFHFACDIKVNYILNQTGFESGRYTHLGYVYGNNPWNPIDVENMNPSEILGTIPFSLYSLDDRSRSKYLADNDSCWDNWNSDEIKGTLVLDINAEYGFINAKTIKESWKILATQIGKTMFGKDGFEIGDVPEAIKRIIKKAETPVVDWRRELNDFIQEQICDYTFSPPDRRFYDTGFFLPDYNEKDYVIKEILFMVDTSGSIDDDILGSVYSELQGAIEQFSGKLQGKLGFFDEAVTPPKPFESVDDLFKITPIGGGGTNFCCVFDYLRCECIDNLPASVVIFTDGYGPYPKESETLNLPVLWVMHNTVEEPPFGKIIHINE